VFGFSRPPQLKPSPPVNIDQYVIIYILRNYCLRGHLLNICILIYITLVQTLAYLLINRISLVYEFNF
jgi:hypothetical protein